jgi:hypothetical protein
MGGAVSVTNIVDATIEESCSKVGQGEYEYEYSSEISSSSYFLRPSRRSRYEYADNEGNNRCDQLAVAAAQGSSLLVDAGFEAVKSHPPSLLGL